MHLKSREKAFHSLLNAKDAITCNLSSLRCIKCWWLVPVIRRLIKLIENSPKCIIYSFYKINLISTKNILLEIRRKKSLTQVYHNVFPHLINIFPITDLQHAARWIRATQDKREWIRLRKAYVKQWTFEPWWWCGYVYRRWKMQMLLFFCSLFQVFLE